MGQETVERETQLRIVARLAAVGGWCLELDSLRFHPSPEWLHLHDCKPTSRPTTKQVLRHIAPADRHELIRRLRRCARRGEPFEMVIASRTFANRRVHMRLIGEPEFDDLGHVARIVGACQDVSLQVERELELAQHRSRLEDLVEQRTRDLRTFSYALAHDLRAPISAMAGFSQVVAERLPDDLRARLGHYVDRIVANAGHAEDLIEGILELASALQAPLHRQAVDLSAIAWQALEHLRAHEPQRPVDVEVQPALNATGDRRLLMSVMQNLLGNAWKFSLHRNPARIEFGRTPQGVFYVRDNGVGFSMEEAGQLFEPLRRLPNPLNVKGTGVGLAMASRIVTRHGGRMWAEAEPGVGATFWFTLGEGG
jgi:signal transduction histidine kinase